MCKDNMNCEKKIGEGFECPLQCKDEIKKIVKETIQEFYSNLSKDLGFKRTI